MKKLHIYLILIISLSCIFCIDVNAASIPYAWYVNGKIIEETNEAKVSREGKTITLTLNNYNGGQLREECYGTGQEGIIFNIVLIGDNIINVEDGIGKTIEYMNDTVDASIGISMESSFAKINFLGEGTLTINAPKPISYENYTNYLYISPSKNIYTNEKAINNDTSNQENQTNQEQTTNTNTNNQDQTVNTDNSSLENTDGQEQNVNSDNNAKENSTKNNENSLMIKILLLLCIVNLIFSIVLTIKVMKNSKSSS